jgi:hypothetical protein
LIKGQAVEKYYILPDFENVQPKNLAVLYGHPFKVLVFAGAAQAKVPFEFKYFAIENDNVSYMLSISQS